MDSRDLRPLFDELDRVEAEVLRCEREIDEIHGGQRFSFNRSSAELMGFRIRYCSLEQAICILIADMEEP